MLFAVSKNPPNRRAFEKGERINKNVIIEKNPGNILDEYLLSSGKVGDELVDEFCGSKRGRNILGSGTEFYDIYT